MTVSEPFAESGRGVVQRVAAAFLVVLVVFSVGFGATHRHEIGGSLQDCAVCHVAGSVAVPASDISVPADRLVDWSPAPSSIRTILLNPPHVRPPARAPPAEA